MKSKKNKIFKLYIYIFELNEEIKKVDNFQWSTYLIWYPRHFVIYLFVYRLKAILTKQGKSLKSKRWLTKIKTKQLIDKLINN